MSDTSWRETRETSYDGKTRKLEPSPDGSSPCGVRFPWQVLWLIWPLMFMLKGAFFLGAPALAWFERTAVASGALLPLLLIGAGVTIILIGKAQR